MPHKETRRPAYEGEYWLILPPGIALTSRLDVADCQAAMFEWAESFDTKDWDRLSKCIAPTLYVSLRL